MFWDEFFWSYDAFPPRRTNLTILPGTTASVRGVSGHNSSAQSEYDADRHEWTATLDAGIPTLSGGGVSEMWCVPVLLP